MLLSEARKTWSLPANAEFTLRLQAFAAQLGGTRIAALEAENRLPQAAWNSLRDAWNNLEISSAEAFIIAAACNAMNNYTFQTAPPQPTFLLSRERLGLTPPLPAYFFRVMRTRAPRARRVERNSADLAPQDTTRLAVEDELHDPSLSWAFRFPPIWCTWGETSSGNRPPFATIIEANEKLALDISPSAIRPGSHLILAYRIDSVSPLLIPILADAVRPGAGGTHSWHRYFHPSPSGQPCGYTRPFQPNIAGLPEAVHDRTAIRDVMEIPEL